MGYEMKDSMNTWMEENCARHIEEFYVDGVKDEKRTRYTYEPVVGKYETTHYHYRSDYKYLSGYNLKNGKIVYMREQAYFEDPNIAFICVTDEDGNDIPESVWTEEEMNKYKKGK